MSIDIKLDRVKTSIVQVTNFSCKCGAELTETEEFKRKAICIDRMLCGNVNERTD